jgi:hypothetical protein
MQNANLLQLLLFFTSIEVENSQNPWEDKSGYEV